MKKKNLLALGLAALLLVESMTMNVAAADVTEPPSETVSQVTEATQPPETTPPTEPETRPAEIPFGEAGVTYGCRTIEGRIPLGGSQKLLNTAKSVFVYETNSDTVLYGYRPDERLAPGGLVQIVTAMLAVENCNLNDVITVSTRYINELPLGVRHQNLRKDEEVTVRDLVYCLLLASANDAAVVLAQHVGGTPTAFIEMMNQRAVELGCTNTNFTTVNGLDDPNQYSTARDMARILGAAMENEDLGEGVFCHGMGDHFGILSDGTVIPCCLDADGVISLGNVYETPLSEIISSERAVKIREGFRCKRAVEELCKRCPYARRFKI